MSESWSGSRALALLGLCASMFGCVRGCPSSRPPIHLNPNMDYQPKYQPQESSGFFYDGSAMRLPVPGTVARDEEWPENTLQTGRDATGAFVAELPLSADESLLARGAQRYGIYCAPCHDPRGNGRGILYERASVPTPSFHDERIVALADGEVFDVITHGKGLMPAYGYPIPPRDRWAIIAHVRQLQRESREREVASRE